MTITRPRSLYDVLNVSPEAEPVVIEAAYKALIKKYHPDQAAETGALSPDAADLNKAFAVLKDPGRRAEYDHRLWVRDQAMRAAAAPPAPRSRFVGAAGWIAAILLGGVIAAMAIGREVGTPPPLRHAAAADDGAAAADADPGGAGRTPAFLSREQAEADVKAMAEVGADRYRRELPPPPQLRIVEEAAPVPYVAPEPRYVAPPAPARRRAPPPPPRRRPAPETPAEDAEFLERQGYIY